MSNLQQKEVIDCSIEPYTDEEIRKIQKKRERIKKDVAALRRCEIMIFASILSFMGSLYIGQNLCDRNPSLAGPFNYFDDTPDEDEHALDFLILSWVLGFLSVSCAVAQAVNIPELRSKLKIDKEQYKRLLKLLDSYGLIKDNALDVDGLRQVVKEGSKKSPENVLEIGIKE